MSIEKLVKDFHLEPHPEGGFYKETYRSSVMVDTERGERSASTGIYFLLGKNNISHFHRIAFDELWHFYQGDPLEIIEITPEGELFRTKLGEDNIYQYTVKGGNWFASRSLGDYSFVGCTVAPGFDFNDFEMAVESIMLENYPNHRDIIIEFTLKP